MSRRISRRQSDVPLHTAKGFVHLDILTAVECVGRLRPEVTQSVVMSCRMSRSTRAMITASRVHRRMTRMSATSDVPRKRGQKRGPIGIGKVGLGLLGRHGRLTAVGTDLVHTRLVPQWTTRMVPWTGRATNEDGAKSPRRRRSRTATYANRIALGSNVESAPRRYVRNAMTKARNACATNLRSVTATISSRS